MLFSMMLGKLQIQAHAKLSHAASHNIALHFSKVERGCKHDAVPTQ